MAIVTLVSVLLAGAYAKSRCKSGTVILRAQSKGIDFDYAYAFENVESVPEAVDQATSHLKQSLDELSAATERVDRSDQCDPATPTRSPTKSRAV
jgi:hypothetical protein